MKVRSCCCVISIDYPCMVNGVNQGHKRGTDWNSIKISFNWDPLEQGSKGETIERTWGVFQSQLSR